MIDVPDTLTNEDSFVIIIEKEYHINSDISF